MDKKNKTATTGIKELDGIIRSLWIGDNVVWEIESGTYMDVFTDLFVKSSLDGGQDVVYVSFNRSPATMMKRLGLRAGDRRFTLLDCFTAGKGRGDATFRKFYADEGAARRGAILFEKPSDPAAFLKALTAIEDEKGRGARYVFDSLTGMQDLWGGEDMAYKLFTRSCPRLYDFDTVAYWILEKDAHGDSFRANLKHITQVALELFTSGPRLYLKANKVEGRFARNLYKPRQYEVSDGRIQFAEEDGPRRLDIGAKVKNMRVQRGITQRELADSAGVTPSFISQVERNQISPSIASLIDIAAELRVEPSYFLSDTSAGAAGRALVRKAARKPFVAPALKRAGMKVSALTSDVPGRRMESFMVELPAGASGSSPIFMHKGEEFGTVVAGKLELELPSGVLELGEGDSFYLEAAPPVSWKNPGKKAAQVVWVLSPSRV